MFYVQQKYFLHAHSSMSVDVLAVASLITMYAKLSERCHDRKTVVEWKKKI